MCPVLNPLHTMDALENGSPVYHKFFLRKWKHSLATKLKYYPELDYGESLSGIRSLKQMNEFFVPRHTEFEDPPSYYDAYALTGDTLADLSVPSRIIISEDDPIIPADDLAHVAESPSLSIELTRYGGHCGFLMNWRLQGWIDQRLLELFI